MRRPAADSGARPSLDRRATRRSAVFDYQKHCPAYISVLKATSGTVDMRSVEILAAEDADMQRVFECTANAFARNEPFFDVTYPEHWTEQGRKNGAERLLQIKNSDSNTTFLKAVDSHTGEIIGMAKWNVYGNRNILPDMSPVTDLGDYWQTPEEKQYAIDAVNTFLEDRYEAIRTRNGNLVSLDVLAIDPAYQRQGVGGALVRWERLQLRETAKSSWLEDAAGGELCMAGTAKETVAPLCSALTLLNWRH